MRYRVLLKSQGKNRGKTVIFLALKIPFTSAVAKILTLTFAHTRIKHIC